MGHRFASHAIARNAHSAVVRPGAPSYHPVCGSPDTLQIGVDRTVEVDLADNQHCKNHPEGRPT